MAKYNTKSSCDDSLDAANFAAVKRIMQEIKELKEPTEHYYAAPLEVTHGEPELIRQDNLYEWHFTVRGPPDSEFAEGFYHGRIILPPEYPLKPPAILILTVIDVVFFSTDFQN